MEFITIDVHPGDITFDLKIVCRLMGLESDNIPEPYNEIIKWELDETDNYSNIKGGYRISENIDIDSPKEIFVFEDTVFEAGKQVVNNLKKSELFALYICTAGEEVSRRSKEFMRSGNLLEGYVTDLVGSLLVEKAVGILHKRLANEMKGKGLEITNCYSPGYCNWKVDEQHKLFSFFPDGFCGVRLSESALMNPIKSVSGVIGIGKKVRFHKYICNACSSVNCIYRNIKYSL